VVVLPADIIFSETVPDPVIETVRGYFLFSKFDVMVWFELTVTDSGLSVDPLDQLTKTYSESGVAVIETLDPDSKGPPELETFPPVEDVTVKLNVITDSTVSGESFPQDMTNSRKKRGFKKCFMKELYKKNESTILYGAIRCNYNLS
jgi:hypothetical protein